MPTLPAITWTTVDTLPTVAWTFVRWFADISLFVAGGVRAEGSPTGVVATSPDGITWTPRADPLFDELEPRDAAYEPTSGRIVVVGDKFPQAYTGLCVTSDDGGATWVAHDVLPGELDASNRAFEPKSIVATSGGRLVASARLAYTDLGQHPIAISDDGGDNWTGVSLPSPYATGLVSTIQLAKNADNSILVCAMSNPAASQKQAKSADNGATWTTHALPVGGGGLISTDAVAFLDGVGFVVMGHESAALDNQMWTAADGATWVRTYAGNGSYIWPGPYTPGLSAINRTTAPFLLVGELTDTAIALHASYDAANWFTNPDPLSTDETWQSAAYSPAPDRIVLVGLFGTRERGDLSSGGGDVEPDPDDGVHGWPMRLGRRGYSRGGADMRDEKRVPDPGGYLGADRMNLAYWQLGALGICEPKILMTFAPTDPGTGAPRLKFGRFTWDQVTYVDRAAAFPWFTYAVVGGNTMEFTFDAQVPGQDGLMLNLNLRHGRAAPIKLFGVSQTERIIPNVKLAVGPTKATVYLYGRTTADYVLFPVTIALW